MLSLSEQLRRLSGS
ncbi:hypothetical protein [Enterobacter sp. CPE_E331]